MTKTRLSIMYHQRLVHENKILLKRRTFLVQGSLLTTGYYFRKLLPFPGNTITPGTSLYSLFKNPDSFYRPFVRWWWNGDKVEREELARELRLLKEAGIGGVEINPVKFPPGTKDLGKPDVQWLSAEWIDLVRFTLKRAGWLGRTCDPLDGS